MKTLELKVPPVALVLMTAAAMALCARFLPAFNGLLPGRYVVAAVLAAAGFVISILGVVAFRRARTTVNPMMPNTSSSLVMSGVYRITRNPMYLGFLLILLGWGAFLSNGPAFALLPFFVLYMSRFQIRPEERALESRFGGEFVSYRGRVRRWI
ncbi:MAG TPA: isoprenylcysteine carboxylmethyltransferase family protein [Planctomycetota bacterium]|nr:isoprenylcysteine carboxylmethyltransferase family protein [Planctomycetota bacterium]